MKQTGPAPIFADDPVSAALGMLCHATVQEKLAGFPGWCLAPPHLALHLERLRADGLAEPQPGHDGWWRATAAALSRLRHVGEAGRA